MELRAHERMMKGHNESGFTFLEMILVLSVVSLVTFIILPIGDKWIRSASEEDGLQAFVAAIHNIQAYSMANNVATRLDFKNSGTMYITLVPGKREFVRTTFPMGMRLSDSSSMKAVEFQPNGDIVRSGTLVLETSSGLTEIRFQFQRGRMIVYE
ncbi:prepilin-type N-terminal cleavage/methylation domain-containing protein [Sporosarcina beigongshangi]|uniref:prepilin-type N-terminal cleavage/methylation domain-containing protein n=1 Tax=Sporosarcina beigongshangi TaxID=2782538 RepID=UPI0019394432|nr:type II secretion system protein [Sporosarcina beigongshangi]